MEKGQGNGMDTLQTNNVFTRKEYIEREALIDEINIAPVSMSICMNVDECKGRIYERERLVRIINEATAADVVPVQHGHKVTHNRPIAGHWVSGKLDGGWDDMEGRVWVQPLENNPVDYCSECGKRLDDTFQKYCPNCGALMDKDGDGDV